MIAHRETQDSTRQQRLRQSEMLNIKPKFIHSVHTGVNTKVYKSLLMSQPRAGGERERDRTRHGGIEGLPEPALHTHVEP